MGFFAGNVFLSGGGTSGPLLPTCLDGELAARCVPSPWLKPTALGGMCYPGLCQSPAQAPRWPRPDLRALASGQSWVESVVGTRPDAVTGAPAPGAEDAPPAADPLASTSYPDADPADPL
eukprot:EG_transcript_13088